MPDCEGVSNYVRLLRPIAPGLFIFTSLYCLLSGTYTTVYTRWRPVVSLPTITVIETMICQVLILPQDVIHTPLQEITCVVWICRMLNAQRHFLMKLHKLTWVALQALLRVARYTLLSTHLLTYPTPRRIKVYIMKSLETVLIWCNVY